jgi:hypothetical protein
MPETTGGDVRAAVLAFLSGLELQGADVARGEIALALAAALDGTAPPYALGGLSAELRSLLDELADDGKHQGDVLLAELRARAKRKMAAVD